MNKRLLERTFNEPSERLEIILSTQEELIAEQEEALKEENYLSPRERQDRQMNIGFMALVENIWKKITDKPFDEQIILAQLLFAFLVMATIFVLFYALIIIPVGLTINYVWDLLFNTLPK